MPIQQWYKLPHRWIEDGGLRDFRWRDGHGADNAAALMLLAGLVHNADPETGYARLTYDAWQHLTGLSRSKVSKGLFLLTERGIIKRPNPGSSEVYLCNFDAATWAKLPARSLYNKAGQIAFFQKLTLRGRVQLDLLKLWFLFCSRRNRNTNLVELTYDTIERYTGIERPRITDAIGLGLNYSIIVVDKSYDPIEQSARCVYRVRYIDSYTHFATSRIEAPENMF